MGAAITELKPELERLAESAATPEAYFAEFLRIVCDGIGSNGGEAWGLSQQGLLAVVAKHGEPIAARSHEDASEKRRQVQRLLQTLHSAQPTVYAPQEPAGEPAPTSLLAPLRMGENTIGAMEIGLPSQTTMEAAREKLETLCELAKHASAYLNALPEPSEQRDVELEAAFLRSVETFLLSLASQATAKGVAETAANEARRIIGADRVSIAVPHGGRADILAVSGQDKIVKRANTVRALAALATEALGSGQEIRYSGDLQGFAPQVERVLGDCLRETGATEIRCTPLHRFEPPNQDDTQQGGQHPPAGVLIVERFGDEQLDVPWEFAERLNSHVGQALFRAGEHDRVLLQPLRRSLGGVLAWARGDGLRKCVFAGAVAAGVILSLALIPAPYGVKADGQLFPAIRSRVFAQHDGQVIEVFVRDGQRVEASQPLLQLRNDDLSIRLLTTHNAIQEKQQQLTSYQTQESESRRGASASEQTRLRGRITQTEIEIASLQQQAKHLQARLDQLLVRATVDGVVATFRPQELLSGRPVHRGHLLLELVEPRGPWQLELDVPANGMGRILSARRGAEDALPVDFVLATSPERTYSGRLQRLSSRAESDANGAVTVQAIARVDEVATPAVGAEVTARIRCGRTNLAYALFGELIEGVKRYVW